MSWVELAETEKAKALERLNTSERILKMASSNYFADPSWANEVAMKAAEELLKESMAMAQEWVND